MKKHKFAPSGRAGTTRRGAATLLLAAGLLLGGPAAQSYAAAKVAPDCAYTFIAVGARNPATQSNELNGVAGLAANDVWAVGDDYSTKQLTLAEHWDSTSWTTVFTPSPGTTASRLNSVTEVAVNDVWAAGTQTNSDTTYGLIEHYDGVSWRVIFSPQTINATLNGIAAVSASDIWAVGYHYDNSVSSKLFTQIEHYDGTSWHAIYAPSPGSQTNILNGVAVVASNDVWAVGFQGDAMGATTTLIEHWNGTAWSVVTSANPTPGFDSLQGVTAVASNNVWAVGNQGNAPGTLIEHWNGTAWSAVAGDNTVTNGDFTGVVAISATEIYAVGNQGSQTLAEQWNGTSWTVLASANPGTGNLFHGVGRADTKVWAVGLQSSSGTPPTKVLTERLNRTCDGQ